jgi:hypothetical protein
MNHDTSQQKTTFSESVTLVLFTRSNCHFALRLCVVLASQQAGTMHGIYDHFIFFLGGTTVHCGGFLLMCVCVCVGPAV